MPTRIEQYQALPKEVSDFFSSISRQDELVARLTTHGLTEDDAFSAVLLAEDVVLKNITLDQLEAKVGEIPGVSDTNRQAIVRDLIGFRLLPLIAYYPEFKNALEKAGGKVEEYPKEKVEKRLLTPETFAREVLNQSGLHLSDKTFQSRLEFIVGSYVREARTRDQTIATMQRPQKLGGLELKLDQAEKILRVIDEKKDLVEIDEDQMPEREIEETKPTESAPPTLVKPEVEPKPLPKVVEEFKVDPPKASESKASPVNPFTAARQKREQQMSEHHNQEAEVLAKRYAAMTGKVPDKADEVGGLPSARVTAFESKEATLSFHEKQVNQAAKAVLSQGAPRPEPVLPKLSTPSVPPQGKDRPSVSDVKYSPKLVSLVEELGQMDPVEFRRLSSDPEQAIMKIEDKISLLTDESYEKRIQGIKAWQTSPINKMYVELSREMLRTNKPLEALLDEMKQQGKETLNAAEVRAIIKLNGSLRF